MVLAITVYTETARAKGFTLPEPDFYTESSQMADWSQSAEHANAEVQDFSAPSAPDDVWEPDSDAWPKEID